MKKLNKIFVVTTFCVLLISLFMTVSISADSSGICGDSLTWTLRDDGTLIISGTGDMYDYDKSESPWYTLNESVKNIEIGEDVTSIGEYAFYESSVEKITVPDNVTHIAKGAFKRCQYIKSVVIGDSVKEIGYSAFEKCVSLTNISFGTGITSIGDHSFEWCSSLRLTAIPDTVTSIGNYSFSYCKSLVQVFIPDSVTEIGEDVFYGCGNMFVHSNCGSTAFHHDFGKVNRSWSCDKLTDGFVYNYDATCTEDGTETVTCQICGMQNTRKAEGTASGHRYTLYYSNRDADCTKDGTKTRSCAWCDLKETVTDEGSALGHSYSYSRNNDATCTEDGTLTGRCVRCQETIVISDISSALGHAAGEWQITKEPSYNAEGEKVKYCTVCNEILETESIPALEKEMTFTDVKAEHWYYNAVEYCYKRNIINGVSDSEFAPGTELSRAMLVRILWNMEGCPETTENHFADIGTDRWYTDAVNWAAENGIVAGMDSEHFCPEDSITREQLAAIMQRYSAYLGNDVSARADLNNYADADKISDWAHESLEWAVSVGIISGRSETLLTPKGTATRAETAQIIYGFKMNN